MPGLAVEGGGGRLVPKFAGLTRDCVAEVGAGGAGAGLDAGASKGGGEGS
jgi:hypothetical protein